MADQTRRILWIDALRGLAIMLMVPANLSPYFSEPHPMWFRILGSFAAPTFIMLSAGMVILTAHKHDAFYYLKRGGLIIAIGALLDVALWGIFPFTSFDVLYPIGLALPLMYMLRRVDSRELLYIAIIFMLATYAVQQLFGYHEEVLEVYFTDIFFPDVARIVQSYFVDGWFPIFPWIGYAVLGALFFRTLFDSTAIASLRVLIMGAVFAGAGFAMLFVPVDSDILRNITNSSILESRSGYSEIFYPPTFAYIIASVGVVILSAAVLQRIRFTGPISLLLFFGRYSMMVYILHQAFGVYALEPIIAVLDIETIESGPWFTVANLAVLAAIWLTCSAIDMLKQRRPPRSMLAQILFGK